LCFYSFFFQMALPSAVLHRPSLSPQAALSDDTHVSLSALPAEIVLHITDMIERGSDLVAWCVATGVDGSTTARRMAKRYPGGDPHRLLAMGAPLDVVKQSIQASSKAPSMAMTRWAVKGGRLDVVKYVWNEACDRERMPKEGHPQRSKIERDQGAHIKNALREACDLSGRIDVILWLLTRLPSPNGFHASSIVESTIVRAAAAGRLDIVRAIHDKRVAAFGICDCTLAIADAAINHGHSEIAAWLHEGSRTCRGSGHRVLFHANLHGIISRGDVDTARWLIAVGSRFSDSPRLTVSSDSAQHAAESGSLPMVAFLHEQGLYACSGYLLALLIRYSKDEAVEAVLRWAAGEPTSHANEPQLDDHDDNSKREPIDAFYDPIVACALIDRRMSRAHTASAFRWLLARPDAARFFTPGIVRWALTRPRACERALEVCAAGIVSFEACDALATVARHRNPRVVDQAIDAGAPYTLSAMMAALQGEEGVLDLLCQRYGTSDLGAALDALSGHVLPKHAIIWIRKHAPQVCIAQARALFVASDMAHVRDALLCDSCVCFRCAGDSAKP
jgi:hypothetical protein